MGLTSARELIDHFKAATTSELAREILDKAINAADADNCYHALKLVRRIIRHEDNVMGRTALGSSMMTNAVEETALS